MAGYLPNKEAVLEHLRKNLVHAATVEYYLEKLPNFKEFEFVGNAVDAERPHDFSGYGSKADLSVSLGFASMDEVDLGRVPETSAEAAKKLFMKGLAAHSKQKHQMINKNPELVPEEEREYQLVVWAVDTYCKKLENRVYERAVPHDKIPENVYFKNPDNERVFKAVYSRISQINREEGVPPLLDSKISLQEFICLGHEKAGLSEKTYYALIAEVIRGAVAAEQFYFDWH